VHRHVPTNGVDQRLVHVEQLGDGVHQVLLGAAADQLVLVDGFLEDCADHRGAVRPALLIVTVVERGVVFQQVLRKQQLLVVGEVERWARQHELQLLIGRTEVILELVGIHHLHLVCAYAGDVLVFDALPNQPEHQLLANRRDLLP
jgi:hypothetical protein